MSRVRTGIEIPIIPEDFLETEEKPYVGMLESCLIQVPRKSPDGLDPEDWLITEVLVDRYPKNDKP